MRQVCVQFDGDTPQVSSIQYRRFALRRLEVISVMLQASESHSANKGVTHANHNGRSLQAGQASESNEDEEEKGGSSMSPKLGGYASRSRERISQFVQEETRSNATSLMTQGVEVAQSPESTSISNKRDPSSVEDLLWSGEDMHPRRSTCSREWVHNHLLEKQYQIGFWIPKSISVTKYSVAVACAMAAGYIIIEAVASLADPTAIVLRSIMLGIGIMFVALTFTDFFRQHFNAIVLAALICGTVATSMLIQTSGVFGQTLY